jgi:hypothetical protein
MAGGTRSHSPPLPPNATYNHPIISLNILPSAKLFTAGSKVTGMLEVICKERNSVALGQLAIEFFGIEGSWSAFFMYYSRSSWTD